ncbi:MAG: UvrD-helicase domain-containing protein [bacterium]|nr:UvrD-helicase domain-containing protein [bacterium]
MSGFEGFDDAAKRPANPGPKGNPGGPNGVFFMDALLENLNDNQKKAVLHKDGPLLVLAGAGAGKTRAISHRVAYLVSQGVEPNRILAVTFTNKAAAEMRERITDLLRESAPSSRASIDKSNNDPTASPRDEGADSLRKKPAPLISTFHSLGVHILRRHGASVGAPRNFSIFDKEDSLSLMKSAIKDLGLDPKQFQPAKMQSLISRYKGDLIGNEEFAASAGEDFFPGTLSRIWNKYEEYLKEQKALDFSDLIYKTVVLLKTNKDVREYYQNLWQYIMIDEYQDTNKGQYELSKILAAKHKNICVIGDIDQCIYSWRGADFRNITNFERDYPDNVLVVLEENYRSTQTILEAAANIIEKNKMRKPKRLIAKKEKGAEISLFEAMTEQEEADFVAGKLKEIFAQSGGDEAAVLYRANYQSRAIEEACLKHGVPYHVLGTQFYKRKEVKDIFSFLRAAINPQSMLDIKRTINVPPRGIGKVTILNHFSGKELPVGAREKVADFFKLLEEIKKRMATDKLPDIIRFIMMESGYQKFLEEGGDDDRERLENLKELVTIAGRYNHLPGEEAAEKMLEDAALMSDQDSMNKSEGAQPVRLMTVHSAKGLEFKNVFIVGLEDGLFPHSGFGDGGPEKEEEERRLFYVAVTRAKEKLFLSFSVSRTVFGSKQLNMPSRFLSDIPEHLMKMEERGEKEKVIEID